MRRIGGVIGSILEPARYRFAAIFDSSRALLWSLGDARVERLLRDGRAFRSHLYRAKPCIGPVRDHPNVNNCSHFDFVVNLMDLVVRIREDALIVSYSCEELRRRRLSGNHDLEDDKREELSVIKNPTRQRMG